MEYNELSAAATEQLRKATSGIVDELRKRLGNDVIDAVLAEVKKASSDAGGARHDAVDRFDRFGRSARSGSCCGWC